MAPARSGDRFSRVLSYCREAAGRLPAHRGGAQLRPLLRTKPSRWSSSNLHLLPDEVHALARTCKRPERSFIAKMMNLDGSRSNGQREEPDLFVRFRLEPDVFTRIYRVVIDRCDALPGLDHVAVPDYLGLLGHADDMDILGQEELGPSEVAEAVESRRSNGGSLRRTTASTRSRRRASSSSGFASASTALPSPCSTTTDGPACSAASRPVYFAAPASSSRRT